MKRALLAAVGAGSFFVVGSASEQKYSLMRRAQSVVSRDYAAAEHDSHTVLRTDYGSSAKTKACPKNPIVILTLGQSNAANYVTARFHGKGTVFYRGQCYEASDPLLGATGDRGSIWSRLSDRLPNNIVFVNVAVASSSMEAWSPGGILNDRVLAAINYLKEARLAVNYVLIQQGEFEGISHANPELYEKNAAALVRQLQAEGAKVIFATSSSCGKEMNVEIRRAQANVRRITRAIAGPDMDTFSAFRANICHLTDKGANKAADEWASIVSSH